MAVDTAKRHALDPLAEQAATLLAKAMVTSHEREDLWQQFRDLVPPRQRNSRRLPCARRSVRWSARD